jgi:hypothetical protein
MAVAILVLCLVCLVTLLITGFVIDTNDPYDIEALGLVITFLVVPMLMAMAVLGIIQVAS